MGNEQGSKFQQGTFNWEAGVKPQGPGARAELPVASPPTENPRFGETLMEEVCERRNMLAALKQVRANQGSPGSDGRSVEELPASPDVLACDQRPTARRDVPTPGD